MRLDDITQSLWDNVTSIKGIGKTLSAQLSKLKIVTKLDLLLHLPIKAEVTAIHNSTRTIIPIEYQIPRNKYFSKRPASIIAEDQSGNIIEIKYFNYYSINYLKKLFPLGIAKNITGKFEQRSYNLLSIHHPKVSTITTGDASPQPQKTSPLSLKRTYKTVHGITSSKLSSLIHTLLAEKYTLPEWHSEELVRAYQLPTFIDALKHIHTQDNFKLDPTDKSLFRLALDETLSFYLKLTEMLYQQGNFSSRGYIFSDKKQLITPLSNALPFVLTADQQQIIHDIFADFRSGTQMVRLLQGDVGSGKTIVALFSAVMAVSNNYMVVFMAPTETLAQQHFNTFNEFTQGLNIKLALLTGHTSTKRRKEIISKITNKEIDILIGTHATFQKDLQFDAVGLVIIDEQHRFGVNQRLELINKAAYPHILMLSATPIPRSLALAAYGHIKVSQILQKPSCRKPVTTTVVPVERTQEVLLKLARTILNQNKAYWICPMIDETIKTDDDSLPESNDTSKLNFTAVIERHKSLLKHLPANYVWFLHGRMSSKEKETILQDFRKADQGILVSTTVVEVGIDIPDVNIIIIENAERFGLSQLHQLRGRVGRGDTHSYCILIYNSKSGSKTLERMKIMKNSNNGFDIAAKDFELRGGGNILGTAQSGNTPFKLKFETADLQIRYMKSMADYAKKLYNTHPQKFAKCNSLLSSIFHFDVKGFNYRDIFNNG